MKKKISKFVASDLLLQHIVYYILYTFPHPPQFFAVVSSFVLCEFTYIRELHESEWVSACFVFRFFCIRWSRVGCLVGGYANCLRVDDLVTPGKNVLLPLWNLFSSSACPFRLCVCEDGGCRAEACRLRYLCARPGVKRMQMFKNGFLLPASCHQMSDMLFACMHAG